MKSIQVRPVQRADVVNLFSTSNSLLLAGTRRVVNVSSHNDNIKSSPKPTQGRHFRSKSNNSDDLHQLVGGMFMTEFPTPFEDVPSRQDDVQPEEDSDVQLAVAIENLLEQEYVYQHKKPSKPINSKTTVLSSRKPSSTGHHHQNQKHTAQAINSRVVQDGQGTLSTSEPAHLKPPEQTHNHRKQPSVQSNERSARAEVSKPAGEVADTIDKTKVLQGPAGMSSAQMSKRRKTPHRGSHVDDDVPKVSSPNLDLQESAMKRRPAPCDRIVVNKHVNNHQIVTKLMRTLADRDGPGRCIMLARGSLHTDRLNSVLTSACEILTAERLQLKLQHRFNQELTKAKNNMDGSLIGGAAADSVLSQGVGTSTQGTGGDDIQRFQNQHVEENLVRPSSTSERSATGTMTPQTNTSLWASKGNSTVPSLLQRPGRDHVTEPPAPSPSAADVVSSTAKSGGGQAHANLANDDGLASSSPSNNTSLPSFQYDTAGATAGPFDWDSSPLDLHGSTSVAGFSLRDDEWRPRKNESLLEGPRKQILLFQVRRYPDEEDSQQWHIFPSFYGVAAHAIILPYSKYDRYMGKVKLVTAKPEADNFMRIVCHHNKPADRTARTAQKPKSKHAVGVLSKEQQTHMPELEGLEPVNSLEVVSSTSRRSGGASDESDQESYQYMDPDLWNAPDEPEKSVLGTQKAAEIAGQVVSKLGQHGCVFLAAYKKLDRAAVMEVLCLVNDVLSARKLQALTTISIRKQPLSTITLYTVILAKDVAFRKLADPRFLPTVTPSKEL